MNHINKGVLMEKNDYSKEAIGITKQLAEFASDLVFEKIPPEVVKLAKGYIMDCNGFFRFILLHFNSF